MVAFKFLKGAAIYLAIGALCFATFRGGSFDWHEPMTFVWLVLWPAMLALYSLLAFVLFITAVFAVAAVIAVWG